MIDTYKHKGLRKKMIEEIRQMGVDDEDVLNAMMQVPRHFFLDNAIPEIAYKNKAFSILCGQTISQPYTVAFQTCLLNLKPYEKVLEIGTGSGYQASILAFMNCIVYSIERQKELYSHLLLNSYIKTLSNLKLFYGDGFAGLIQFAPFDKIIITAAAPEIPISLVKQLKVNGKMVLPLKHEKGFEEMLLLIKTNENNEYIVEKHGKFKFVPMLKGKQGN